MEIFNSLLQYLNEHWLLVAFLAPACWSVANLFDVYFVGQVYRDEFDGSMIFGLFQVLPLVVLILYFGKTSDWNFTNIDLVPALWLAIGGGFIFLNAFYFYFKALFAQNDAALLQILWSLTIVVVPILSFVFFKEILSIRQYAGMGIVLLGSFLLSISGVLRAKLSKRYVLIMLGAVVLLSLAMVMEGQAYLLLDQSIGQEGFKLGFAGFCLGGFLAGLMFAIIGKRNPLILIKKYAHIFLIIEGVTFLGNFFSQKALSISPSVSFVATAETFVPVFILVFSLFLLWIFYYILKRNTDFLRKLYQGQLEGLWFKVMATLIMAFGVYIIN
ncbi:MAG: EamA family transporter [Patescibacteria group bacterium]|jgi:drug/metabolite transporter (DMT)-like permease